MLNAFLVPLLRWRPVNLVDVWDPAEVLRLMLDERLGMSAAAHVLPDQPARPPRLHRRAPGAHALRRARRLARAGWPSPSGHETRHQGVPLLRQHRAPVDHRLHRRRPGESSASRTDGHPLPGVELRLDDEGQILSRGPDLFVGYTDPELTARVVDDEGWYHTGDIGVLDDEGYLTITDRISDIIIRGGENISAREIEELLASMDGVAEVSVVAAPDDRLGERAAAVLLVRPGHDAPTLDAMRRHLADAGLARQKWPESIHVVAELPRTPSGKVQKFVLRDRLRDGELDVAEGV